MLKDFLSGDIENRKNEIIKYISNYGQKQIYCIFCWSMVEYQQGLFIYSSKKIQYSNELEAFLELWAKSLIDIEEWHDYFKSSMEFAVPIYENFFKEDYKKYNIREISIDDANTYISCSIKDMLENMTYTRNRYMVETYTHKLPNGVPGIYVNGSIIKEDEFNFTIEMPIVSAEELSYDDGWAGYRELFLETEDEYIFFTE